MGNIQQAINKEILRKKGREEKLLSCGELGCWGRTLGVGLFVVLLVS